MQPLSWDRRPDGLRAPALVCAFKGWNDAGDAASTALSVPRRRARRHALRARSTPRSSTTSRPTRPTVQARRRRRARDRLAGGRDLRGARRRARRATSCSCSGLEPSMRWRTFCQLVVDLAEALGVQLVVSLGALLADVPHTRPVAITGHRLRRRRCRAARPAAVHLRGPDGDRRRAARRLRGGRACPPASLWAAVPHYVAAAPNPKAALALVRRLESARRRLRRRLRARGRRRRLRAPGRPRRRRATPTSRRSSSASSSAADERRGRARPDRAPVRRRASRASSSASCASAGLRGPLTWRRGRLNAVQRSAAGQTIR